MAESIKDFLVTLGFKVEKGEEARFRQSLDAVAKTAAGIAAALAAAAGAVQAAVIKISADFDNLYFASQRTGASVANIKSLSYAMSQVGGSSGQAGAAIEGVAAALRTNPGIEGLLNSIGVATRENGRLKDTAEIIDGIVKSLSVRHPYYTSAQIAGVLGIDEATFQTLVTQWPKIRQYQDEYRKRAAEFGVDPNKAAEGANKLMSSFRSLMLDLDLVGQKIAVELQPLITKYLSDFSAWIRDHSDDIVRWVTAIVEAVRGLAEDLLKLGVALEPIISDFLKMTESLTGASGLKVALEAVLLYMAGAWLTGMLGTLSTLLRHPAFAALVAIMGLGLTVAGTTQESVSAGGDIRAGRLPNQKPSGVKTWWKKLWGQDEESSAPPPKEGLGKVTSKSGKSTWVAKDEQARMQTAIDFLEAKGIQIDEIGGYNPRNIAGTNIPSQHSYGNALDINPSKNPVNGGKTEFTPEIVDFFKSLGLGWGGNWKSKHDPMHLSGAPKEGGSPPPTLEELNRIRQNAGLPPIDAPPPAPEKRPEIDERSKAAPLPPAPEKRSSVDPAVQKQLLAATQALTQASAALTQPAFISGGITRTASIQQSTKIEITGAKEPEATEIAMANLQPRVNAELLRNAKSAFI